MAKDLVFKMQVKEAIEKWEEFRREGLSVISWWEMIVKPGVRKITMDRSKELNRERRGELNLLILRQAYQIKKIQHSNMQA